MERDDRQHGQGDEDSAKAAYGYPIPRSVGHVPAHFRIYIAISAIPFDHSILFNIGHKWPRNWTYAHAAGHAVLSIKFTPVVSDPARSCVCPGHLDGP